MRRAKYSFILSILLCTVFLCCCEKIGDLSEKETEDFFFEIQQDIEKGEFWGWEPIVFHSEKNIKNEIQFLQSSMEFVFRQEEIQSQTNGIWYDSKQYCKILDAQCELSYLYDGIEYTLDRVNVAKYYNRDCFKIELDFYENANKLEMKYIEVLFQCQ